MNNGIGSYIQAAEGIAYPRGPQGVQGIQGPPNELQIGEVKRTVEAGATITGEYPNQKLNLNLPQGDTGPMGPVGMNGFHIDDDGNLIMTVNIADDIDKYSIEDGYLIYESEGTLINMGRVKGISAYESAKIGGYTGTEEEFYQDLAAIQGMRNQ